MALKHVVIAGDYGTGKTRQAKDFIHARKEKEEEIQLVILDSEGHGYEEFMDEFHLHSLRSLVGANQKETFPLHVDMMMPPESISRDIWSSFVSDQMGQCSHLLSKETIRFTMEAEWESGYPDSRQFSSSLEKKANLRESLNLYYQRLAEASAVPADHVTANLSAGRGYYRLFGSDTQLLPFWISLSHLIDWAHKRTVKTPIIIVIDELNESNAQWLHTKQSGPFFEHVFASALEANVQLILLVQSWLEPPMWFEQHPEWFTTNY